LAGQRFLGRVRQAFAHIREGTDEVATIGRAESGHVKVGLFSSLASGFLAELFRRYDENHSGVHIDFIEGEIADHASALRQFQLDIAFVIGSSVWPECETTYLWSEHVFAALSEGHRLAAESELTWEALSKQAFVVQDIGPGKQIRQYIIRKIHESGAGPHVDVQHVGRYNVFNLVALSDRVTLVLESETSISIPGVIYRPIQGEIAPFSAIWSARNDNPPFRALLSLAKLMARPRGETEAEF
jgi:DNA-binding transcriptional LysR family regulator